MPGGGSSRDLTILTGSALVVVIVSVVAVLLEPPATPLGSASTYSAGPEGAKAAFLALKRLGYQVERSFEPLADITVDPAATVLVVASPDLPTSAGDRKAVRRFLEAGGTLLTTGVGGSLLPHLTAVTSHGPAHDLSPADAETYSASRRDRLTEGTPTISMTRQASVSPVRPPYLALFGDAAAPVVLTAPIGAGRAIWWAGSDPLLNASIAKPGHVELLLNVLGPAGTRRVIWSEYYHGHGRSFWSYLAGTAAPVALAQFAFIAVVAFATFGRRRGPIRPLVPESRTSVLEFVEALAGLYKKAGAAAGAVEISLARTRRVLSAAAGLPAGSPDDRIAAASATRVAIDAAQLTATLSRSAEAAGRDDLSPRTALAIVQQLQAIAAAASAATRPPVSRRGTRG